MDEAVWVPTVFMKNRDRLLEADVARKFLAELMDHNELRGLLSDEHFSVDGTQIAAWASMRVSGQRTVRTIRPARAAMARRFSRQPEETPAGVDGVIRPVLVDAGAEAGRA